MMYGVIDHLATGYMSQPDDWIPWKLIAAMIVDGLQGRDCEEHRPLTMSQTQKLIRDPTSQGIEEKSFQRVAVQRPKCVRYI